MSDIHSNKMVHILDSSPGMCEGGEIEAYLNRMFELLCNLLCAQPQVKHIKYGNSFNPNYNYFLNIFIVVINRSHFTKMFSNMPNDRAYVEQLRSNFLNHRSHCSWTDHGRKFNPDWVHLFLSAPSSVYQKELVPYWSIPFVII